MNNKNNFILRSIGFCSAILFMSACSTYKNTVMHRGWHNMNARYNGYYYSRENIKETVRKIEKANKDDFTKPIPLFIYTNNETAKGYYADFDKTIKKSSVVIQHHAIQNKKTKEEIPNACRWIDENYMLIGKAHFYKRDLFSALEAFEYVSKKYPNPNAKYNAMLWMIRTNNEIGSYSLSEQTIDDLRNAKDLPNERAFQQEFAAVSADYSIKRGDYSPAIKQLTKAITLTRKKTVRARYIYVLAQLYEQQGDTKKASQYYSMVPKLHPPYEMAFSARINQAKLYDIQAAGNSKIIRKQLLRMLKDDKNIEYRDQIYYALAALAYKEKDPPLAISYLDKSIRESTTNKTQKALSYLMRADIYFDKPDYKSAQVNYDSTIVFLPKDYPNYTQINEKKKNLNSLVMNINVITLEDSLQRMAKMSEGERAASINKMIAKIEEEEKKKEEEKQLALIHMMDLNQNAQTNNQNTNATAWYFYNPTTVSFGVSEFIKKWGSRKLEDNWRRSEKDQVIANAIADEDGMPVDTSESKNSTTVTTASVKDKKDPNFYLQKIPLTSEALTRSNARIVEAYYNIGSIYKEQLLNNPKSVETFEELLKRFPDNKYKLSCYYQLYRTYMAMNEKTKSDYYKNILLKDYPDTEYAKIIKNPDYAKDVMATKSEVEKFYTETYQLYSDEKYMEALANCQKAEAIYSKNYLMPQFAFIKALCVGRTQDINAFEDALTQVTIKYPKEPVKERAMEMLEMIKKQKNPVTTTIDSTTTPPEKPKFIFKEDGEYYWVTIALNNKGDINKFKTNLSDLNSESFSLDNLNVSNVFLDSNHQLISVKFFNGKAKAMVYYNFMKDSKDVFDALEPGTYQSFIISAENYTTFYREKNIEEYQVFFSQNFK